MTPLQQKLLNLVCEIDRLCRKYEVNYYLLGGSLIGAIRHKGFIPWDDDLDIAMTRDNWQKFMKINRAEFPDGMELHSIDFDDNAGNTVNHFEDMNTTAIYRFNLATLERSGVLIDILILDPIPDNETIKKMYVDKLTAYSDLLTLPYWNAIRIGKSTNFKNNYKRMQKVGRKQALNEIASNIFQFKEEESQLYVQRLPGSPHFWDKSIFGKPQYVPFEDVMLPVPERPGDCLCVGYDDDWMYIPQGGVTKSTHEFCVMNLDIPAKFIMNEFSRRINYDELRECYAQKKIKQDNLVKERYKITCERDIFVSEKIKFIYETRKDKEYLQDSILKKDFNSIESFFREYTEIQCTSRFLGSSALAGWMNWERKCRPLLIDIGDEYLAIALKLYLYQKHMKWVGQILKARHGIHRKFSDDLIEIEQIYFDLKKARSHYECREYKQCRKIVDKYITLIDVIPLVCVLDLSLKSIEIDDKNKVIEKADFYLSYYPADPEILIIKATALQYLGNINTSVDIYEKLIDSTTHGLVLQTVKENIEKIIENSPSRYMYSLWLKVRKRMGEDDIPDINDLYPNNCDNDITDYKINSKILRGSHSLTSVQNKRLLLLKEVDNICKLNGIKYSIFGKTLLQAGRSTYYEDENGVLSIVMTSKECQKFIEAFYEGGYKSRYLDSMYENKHFHRFCLHYCDTTSMDFAIPLCDASNKYGIYLNIEILRHPSKSKLINLFDQMLEAGWESLAQMKWTSRKRLLSYYFIWILCKIFSKARVGKWLYKRFMEDTYDKNQSKYFIKGFWGKRKFLPAYLFKYMTEIKFEDSYFSAIKMYRHYLEMQYGKKWKTRKFPFSKINKFDRLVDDNISGAEFIEYLCEKGINRENIWLSYNKSEKKYTEVKELSEKTNYYWNLICACGERYRLYLKYMPLKTYLIELYKDNNHSKLFKELDDYYQTAINFSRYNIGICFDYDIFKLLEYCLESRREIKIANKLRNSLNNYDLETIKLDFVKPGGGYGMREATQNDLQAILTYLKRYVYDCIYMYIDIKKYGLENPNMKVWLDSNRNGVNLVVMKYHTSISVFSDGDKWNVNDIIDIVRDNKVLSIHGPKRMIEVLDEHLGNNIEVEYGEIYEFTNDRQYEIDKKIELASSDDALEIANLVVTDEGIGGHYIAEELAEQFKERMETGMGRNYVIRDNNRIIAHIASYAEYDKIATISGLIVGKNYRNSIYGAAIEAYIVKALKDEGFKVYSYVITRLRKKLLAALGNKKVAEYGKIVFK